MGVGDADQLVRARRPRAGIRLVAGYTTVTSRYRAGSTNSVSHHGPGRPGVTAGLLLASSIEGGPGRVNWDPVPMARCAALMVDAAADGSVAGMWGPGPGADLVETGGGRHGSIFAGTAPGYLRRRAATWARAKPLQQHVGLQRRHRGDRGSYWLHSSRRPRPCSSASKTDNQRRALLRRLCCAGAAKAASEPALVALLEARCGRSPLQRRLGRCDGNRNSLLEDIFPDLDPHLLEDAEAQLDVTFTCPDRSPLRRCCALLGESETECHLNETRAELTCHFCNEVYGCGRGELREADPGSGLA